MLARLETSQECLVRGARRRARPGATAKNPWTLCGPLQLAPTLEV